MAYEGALLHKPDHRPVPTFLGRWLPVFPPPVDLGLLDGAVIVFVGLFGWMLWYAWHDVLPLPLQDLSLRLWQAAVVFCVLNVAIPRLQDRHASSWIGPLGRHLFLAWVAPFTWRFARPAPEVVEVLPVFSRVWSASGEWGCRVERMAVHPRTYAPPLSSHVPYELARVDRRLGPPAPPLRRRQLRARCKRWVATRRAWNRVILLPPDAGRILHATGHVLGDATMDVSSVHGPAWLRTLATYALGSERKRGFIELWPEASHKLRDPALRAAALANRMPVWTNPQHAMSLHLLCRRRPVEQIARAAGPDSQEAQDVIGPWLVKRRCILVVPGRNSEQLAERIDLLLPQLADSGLRGRRLFKDEIDVLVDDAWGEERAPALTIGPRWCGVETKHMNALAGNITRTHRGVEESVTFVVRGMRESVGLDWCAPFSGGTLHADIAMYVKPKWGVWPELMLRLRVNWWSAIGGLSSEYRKAAAQAQSALDATIAGTGSVLGVGLYITVPLQQAAACEVALRKACGIGNYYAPLLQQREARASTEPFGRDLLKRHMTWTSDIVAATNLAAASSVWPEDGDPIFLGVCGTAPEEPIGLDIVYKGDTSHNIAVLGEPGSGKTMFGHKLVRNVLLPQPEHRLARLRPRVVVVYWKDYDEWADLCHDVGGLHLRPPGLPPRPTGVEARLVDVFGLPVVSADGSGEHDAWRWLAPQLTAASQADVPLVAINLIDVPVPALEQLIPAITHWLKARQKSAKRAGRRRPLFYWLDEAWLPAQTEAGALHIQQTALQSRADDVIFAVATQFVSHLYGTKAFDAVRAATARFFFRLGSTEREIMGREFNLGQTALDLLAQVDAQFEQEVIQRGLGVGQLHNRTTALRVWMFDAERRYGTDPDEQEARRELEAASMVPA